MKRDPRPSPPPLEADDQVVTAVITAAWAVALIVLFAVRHQLPASERWWLWTALAGVVMGLFGLWYVPYLKRSRARRASRRKTGRDGRPDQPPSGSKSVSSTETPGRSTRS